MSGTAAPLLHEIFERTARRWPSSTALEIPPGAGRPERRSLTYADLERRSNALARRLGDFIAGECVAAILLPRHAEELHISQLAILKAGGAFTSKSAPSILYLIRKSFSNGSRWMSVARSRNASSIT